MTRLEELHIKLIYGPGLTDEEYREYECLKNSDLQGPRSNT